MSTIVHLFGTMDPAGAETRTLELLQHRRRGGEHHVFVAMSGNAGALDSDYEALGCEVVHRRLSWHFPFWLARFLHRRRVTHLHSHVQVASGFLLVVGWIAGVPHRIAHFHSMGDGRPDSYRRRLYRASGRILIRLVATDTVAVSRAVLADGAGRLVASGRAQVIYDLVDGARFREPRVASPEATVVIVVGRLDPEKNPARCIEIASVLRRRGHLPGVRLLFVGRGTEHEVRALGCVARERGLEDAVEFLGVRSDVPALLANADILLSTTVREGLPGAIIEASAAGLPAVVSSIPPNEEAARWLPSVVPLPLDCSNERWCEVIEDILAQRVDRFALDAIRSSFERSPFALTGEQSAVDALWS